MTGRLVLVRHGQSHSNVERRLDTRPPGAALTELGHDQARTFGREWPHPVGLVAHSTAVRAEQTAARISEERGLTPLLFEGIHEVQAGHLEDRNDDVAHGEFDVVYRSWHEGDRDAALPGGESGHQVLQRYLPVVDQLRGRYLEDPDWHDDVVVVSHGAAIRLVGAVLGRIHPEFAITHHLANTECVVLSPISDGRWSCLRWAAMTPPFEFGVAGAAGLSSTADPMG